MRTFTVVLVPDHESGGNTVTVPALPGCVTDGTSVDEALSRAREAISLYLSDEDADQYIESGDGTGVIVTQVCVDCKVR